MQLDESEEGSTSLVRIVWLGYHPVHFVEKLEKVPLSNIAKNYKAFQQGFTRVLEKFDDIFSHCN